MYACPLLINLTCLNKAPSVTAVFSEKKMFVVLTYCIGILYNYLILNQKL